MSDNNFIKHRQAAIDWLNGTRDFYSGIAILEASGFRRSPVNRLKQQGENAPEAMSRLKYLMRELIHAWKNGDDTAASTVQPKKDLTISEAYKNLSDGHYPYSVDKLIREYQVIYNQRDKYHKAMAALPEDNTPDVVSMRKNYSDMIAKATDDLERLYPLYEDYTKKGVIPALDLVDPDKTIKPTNDATNGAAIDAGNDAGNHGTNHVTKADLQKKRKSVATKLLRAKNQLEFQQETKADKPNPMPDSPKRVKYETKVENLTKELSEIDYQIAALG